MTRRDGSAGRGGISRGLRRPRCAGAAGAARDAAGILGVLRHRRRRRDHREGERRGLARAEAAPAHAARHRQHRHQRHAARRAGEVADHGGADRPAQPVPRRGRTRHRARRGGGRRALCDVDQRHEHGGGRSPRRAAARRNGSSSTCSRTASTTGALLDRCVAAGFKALVLTVDQPVPGWSPRALSHAGDRARRRAQRQHGRPAGGAHRLRSGPQGHRDVPDHFARPGMAGEALRHAGGGEGRAARRRCGALRRCAA